MREFAQAGCCLVLVLVLNRGYMLVQGPDGCCSEEVVGGVRRHALEVVAVDGARVFGGVGFVDFLAGDCWGLG